MARGSGGDSAVSAASSSTEAERSGTPWGPPSRGSTKPVIHAASGTARPERLSCGRTSSRPLRSCPAHSFLGGHLLPRPCQIDSPSTAPPIAGPGHLVAERAGLAKIGGRTASSPAVSPPSLLGVLLGIGGQAPRAGRTQCSHGTRKGEFSRRHRGKKTGARCGGPQRTRRSAVTRARGTTEQAQVRTHTEIGVCSSSRWRVAGRIQQP